MNGVTLLFIPLTSCILMVSCFPAGSNSSGSGNGSQGYKEDNSLKDLIHLLSNKLETKFDVMDNKMSNVNHNVEMLEAKVEQKFDTLSSKENHIDHKLDMMENKVKEKIDGMEVRAEQTLGMLRTKMDRQQAESTWPMSSFWYWLLGLDVVLTVICRLL